MKTTSAPLFFLLFLLTGYVTPSHQHWLKLGEQACLSGLKPEYLCTMQTDLADLQNRQLEFTVDPLLQARYLGPDGQPQPWLPEAPSVFPDQEIVIAASTGGFMSGKQVTSTGYVDFFWCSDSSCEEILDMAYLWSPKLKTCIHGFAFAAFNDTVSGFGLPHSLDTKPGQNFISQAVRAFPTQGVSYVKKAFAQCNTSPEPETSWQYVGGVNVGPTRQAAQLLARNESELAGFVVEYLGLCTTFIVPFSAWYAGMRMFWEMEACSESKATLLLLGLADARVGYFIDPFVHGTRNTGVGAQLSDWRSLAINCSLFRYQTVAAENKYSDPYSCIPSLESPECYVLVNISSAAGNLKMWGVNITASRWFIGADDIPSPYPPKFSSLVASSLAEAAAGRQGSPDWCSRVPANVVDMYVLDLKTNYTEGVLTECKYNRTGVNRTVCGSDKFRGTLGTPWQFLREFTSTLWLTNESWSSPSVVYGFGEIDWTYTEDTLELLTRDVQRELSMATVAAISNIDSILKWPGAVFILVISVLAALGAVYQGRDIWEAMSKRKYPYWIKLAVMIIVVGCGALLPIGFIIAGEATTYVNNKQINGISYAQVAVDWPGYSASNVKGSQKLVALVAIKTSYDTSIVAPVILYGVTCALISLLILYFYFRWFLPSSTYPRMSGKAFAGITAPHVMQSPSPKTNLTTSQAPTPPSSAASGKQNAGMLSAQPPPQAPPHPPPPASGKQSPGSNAQTAQPQPQASPPGGQPLNGSQQLKVPSHANTPQGP